MVLLMETKAKILVIDDEAGMRDILSFELGSRGYEVVAVEDGNKGIEKAKHEKFDIAIIDIKLPGMDGITVLENIKNINPETEVIMSTGYGTMETVIESLRKGASDYINKPFYLAEVSASVEKALEKQQLRGMVALYEISKVLFSTIKLEDLLEIIISSTMKILKADDASLMLFDKEGKLYIALSHRLNEQIQRNVKLSIKGVADWVIKNKQPLLLIDGLKNDPRFSDIKSQKEIKSSIVFPLISKRNMLGVLNINRLKIIDNFTKNDLQKANVFVSLVILAMENASLYKNLRETQTQLIQSEKMSGLGQLSGGVAHELNNPLTNVLGTAQVLLTEVPVDNPWHDDIKTIENSALRCRKIINSLLGFAHEGGVSFESADLNSMINNVLTLFEHQMELKNVRIIKNYEKELPSLDVNVSEMEQVFFNIILNAGQSMPEGGNLTITARLAGDKVEISFADTGIGIKKENLRKVLDPFFTTKQVGKGTGLGLSVSYGIVTQHNGTIGVQSEGENKGAIFTVTLPVGKK